MSSKSKITSSPIKSRSTNRKEDHLRYLEKLNAFSLDDTCCELCFCDCYNSQSDLVIDEAISAEDYNGKSTELQDNNDNSKNIDSSKRKKQKKKKSKSSSEMKVKRSNSVGSVGNVRNQSFGFYFHDCRILKDILNNNNNNDDDDDDDDNFSKINNELSFQLCDSMANLCLSSTVREAFRKIPIKDKKILNCMAQNRSEKISINENSWLAKKFWENERYERELMKYEQMEEYKKAIKDKQFQDYLVTKARLQELAQRDLNELQNLRQSLKQKDEQAQRRLNILRIERGIVQCQKRCDELQKNESINLALEEKQLNELRRKAEIYQSLEQRLQKADLIRSNLLENYLKRLRYDNHIEKLMHEENWREVKQCDASKRHALKEHISRKKAKSERFMQRKRSHSSDIAQKAKLSATLRQLVRSSITPDTATAAAAGGGGGGGGGRRAGGAGTGSLIGRMIFERPVSNFSMH